MPQEQRKPGRPRAPRRSWVSVPEDRDAGTAVAPTMLEFLAERFPHVPRDEWRQRFSDGLIQASDGRPLAPDERPRPGQRIAYFRRLAAGQSERGQPERERAASDGAAPVLLTRPGFLVVDKPHFQPVTPGGRWLASCLLYELIERLGEPELQPAHRLDRHTAGLLLFVRRRADRGRYQLLFDGGEVERHYLARCHLPPGGIATAGQTPGTVAADRVAATRWRVASRIEIGEPSFRMASHPPTADRPANAATDIELIADRGDGTALLRLRPESGKKHQLRLHLAGLGLPIVGDRLYPTLRPERPDDPTRPLALLAHRLAFTDPHSGEPIEVESRRRLG